MKIVGLQKLTLLDYPGKTAATVFTPGCNLRCPFCHNAELVFATGVKDIEDVSEEVLSFLDKRQGLLDGICITGGEPLLQEGLAEFCEIVKGKGFSIKLDTNGFFPERLKDLVEGSHIDYLALDVKNTKEKYPETTGIKHIDTSPFFESLDYLLQAPLPYELRTTLVREFHDRESLVEMAKRLQGAKAWFLQGFVDSPQVLAGQGTLHAYTEDEMQELLAAVQAYVPHAALRGV